MKTISIVITGDLSDWNIADFSIDKIPEHIVNAIRSADLFIPNLEGPIKVDGNYPELELVSNKYVNRLLVTGLQAMNRKQPIVCSSRNVLSLLTLCKNTCVTLANNHTKDLGLKGIVDTIGLLGAKHIWHVGAGRSRSEANACKRITIGGKDIFILNANYIGLRKFGFYINIYGATTGSFGAAYLSSEEIGSEVRRIRVESPDAFIIVILHAGRSMARSINETEVDYERFEQTGADCLIFHHSHGYFDTPSGRSFFLGDFIFLDPDTLPESRRGGFVELRIDPYDNQFEYHTHEYHFRGGYPSC